MFGFALFLTNCLRSLLRVTDLFVEWRLTLLDLHILQPWGPLQKFDLFFEPFLYAKHSPGDIHLKVGYRDKQDHMVLTPRDAYSLVQKGTMNPVITK